MAKRFKCNDTTNSLIVNEYLHILIKNDCNVPTNIILTTGDEDQTETEIKTLDFVIRRSRTLG